MSDHATKKKKRKENDEVTLTPPGVQIFTERKGIEKNKRDDM